MQYKVAISFDDGQTHFIHVQGNELVMDAARRQGINIPVDCREGVCATCKGQCESGIYELDYADEDALSEQEIKDGGVLTCQMRVQSDCAVRFDFSSSMCTDKGPEEINTIIKSVDILSETAALLNIDASNAKGQLDFLPGQYAHVNVPETDQWRSYSFSCEPNATNQLQFLIRLLPQGVMSDFLRDRAKPGTTLILKAPLGAFYLREQARPLIMIAGGTGLAPFLGMLDKMINQDNIKVPVKLFYGVTNATDLCELERLQSYAERSSLFTLHYIIMRPSEGWTGEVGLVTDLFRDEHFNGGDVDMYLCGPPPMVDAVKNWLEDKNMVDYKLYFEKFSAS